MNPTELLDCYLLNQPVEGEVPLKELVVAELLGAPSALPAAQPFYRALKVVGSDVGLESLIALRIALAGHAPSDERVLRLREIVADARNATVGEQAEARRRYEAELAPSPAENG